MSDIPIENITCALHPQVRLSDIQTHRKEKQREDISYSSFPVVNTNYTHVQVHDRKLNKYETFKLKMFHTTKRLRRSSSPASPPRLHHSHTLSFEVPVINNRPVWVNK